MSRSDRISIRPMCFGNYLLSKRGDRSCMSCKSSIDCIPPQEETTMAGDTKWIEIPYQGEPDKETLRSVPVSLSKYHREIKPGVWVDVYSVLVAFRVTNPADAHAIKKLLMPGMRGNKDGIQDRREAIASIHRAIEIEEDSERAK